MSYPRWYRQISAPFRSEAWIAAINVLDKALVIAIAAVFIVAAVFLAISLDLRVVRFILVPAIVFGLVTFLRAYWNAPRPYELYDIDPIIVKGTHGLSMPSRHVASAVIISCALAWLHLDWGVVALVASAVVAFTRIVGGVHFPRDVVMAAGIALAFGIIGFAVIP